MSASQISTANISDLTWLESRNNCSRYATDNENSIWVCDFCENEHDPDEDFSCDCSEDLGDAK